MSEIVTVEKWLFARLSADATLTAAVGQHIYSNVAPDATSFPCVVFQRQMGEDLDAIGARRVWSDMIYLVRGIDRGQSFVSLQAIADRIDAVLHAASGTISGGAVFASVRVEPFSLSEVDAGIQYRHLGGMYRIQAK